MGLVKEPIIKLEGEIMSNSQGINKIMQYYDEISKYHDTSVIVDCYNMDWLDANLCALLHAIDYKLEKENNVKVKADFKFLSEKFGVLFRNGWLQHSEIQLDDVQQTTLPCTKFNPDQEEAFTSYLIGKLLCHRGVTIPDKNLRLRIQSDLIEIYTNIYRHAQTDDPFFVCGQYYPQFKHFVFTMVDLGVGFLNPISTYTKGKIGTDIDAIRWALAGNSSTGEPLAGMGLKGIYKYCEEHKGGLQIYSGNAFWGTDLENTIWVGHRPLKYKFEGSVINLFFPFVT